MEISDISRCGESESIFHRRQTQHDSNDNVNDGFIARTTTHLSKNVCFGAYKVANAECLRRRLLHHPHWHSHSQRLQRSCPSPTPTQANRRQVLDALCRHNSRRHMGRSNAIIGQCHSLLHANGVVRIQSDIRVGSRTDKKQGFEDKVAKVEKLLAEDQG
nr:hypothetical protein B0A51_11981 [Rachicladosporium sp. CCFEE 5018]